MKLSPAIKIVMAPALLPDYAEWVKLREQCRACEHFSQDGLAMVCSAVPSQDRGGKKSAGTKRGAVCIGQRDDGAACGPEGKLWKAKA